MIILEGNECTYKTTVAEKLRSKLKIPIFKGSSFELSRSTNEGLHKHFMGLASLKDVIVDRFIYSNRVYATLYNDYAILTDKQRLAVEERIKNRAVVYYLNADTETIKERLSVRGDDYVDMSMIEAINKEYIKTIFDSSLKVVSFNTTYWSSDEIVEEIAKDYAQ